MKAKNLPTADLFLYQFVIKLLGALATYQFVLLFFSGMSN